MGEHHHHHDMKGKNLFIAVILNIVITLSQIIGGIMSGSLALLSDAVHNFSDVLALIVAYFANRLAARPNDTSKTFGYRRAEILAALFNASVLIGIGIFLIIEAFHKFYHPETIDSFWVIVLGVLSILLNTASVLLIRCDASNNINIKVAYLHLLTDVATSVAVVVGGTLMYYFGIFWIDPFISILIALYLIWASFGLIKESGSILMQFVPKGVEIDKIVKEIEKEPEIKDVHHVHIWQLDDNHVHFEAHLNFKDDVMLSVSNRVIDELEKKLYDIFHIDHTTFQCEYERNDKKGVIVSNKG